MSAGKATEMWPFLVSRGRRLGYRVVVAPDFLAAANEVGLLYPIIESDAAEAQGGTRRRVLKTRNGQTVGTVFHEVIADGADLGLPSGALRDTFGRVVAMFEGYVVHGPSTPSIVDWQPTHDIAIAAMRSLLAAESRGSNAEDIPVVRSGPLLKLAASETEQQGGDHHGRLTTVWLVTGILILVLAIVGLLIVVS